MANKKKKSNNKPRKMPQFKGNYCKICGEHKANEKFSGKGHADHICKSCASKSPAQQSEDQTIDKLHDMGFRYINDAEMKWLNNRRKDKRAEVKAIAEEIFQMKFPRQARNEVKKTLHIDEMNFHVHGSLFDPYEVEILVNIHLHVDCGGKITRYAYDENDALTEKKTVTIDKKSIQKFFNVAVHNYDISFWDQDLCLEISTNPYLDLLPEYYDEYGYDPDFEDSEEYEDVLPCGLDNDREETIQESNDRIPTWLVDMHYTNGKQQNIKGYDYLPDPVLKLFFDFEGYFEELPFDDEDFDLDEELDNNEMDIKMFE